MNDIIRQTLYLVLSSTRPMPAHFTSNGERKQSFCIDFEPLTAEDDEFMASESWGVTSDYLSIEKCNGEDLTGKQLNIVTRCGEDLMVGAFILTKLGGSELMSDMKKAIIDDTIENFEDKIDDLINVLSGQQVNKYFDYCMEYGQTRAIQIKT